MAKKKVKKSVNVGDVMTSYMKLQPSKFGLSLGILCAFAMVVFSLWVILVGTGQELINLTSAFYFGYSTTFGGMILGAIYGFIDGFIGGYLFAWLYNKLV